MADQNWTVETNDYRLEALSLALDYMKTGLMGADPKAEKVVAVAEIFRAFLEGGE